MKYIKRDIVEAEQYIKGQEIPVWLLVGIQNGESGHGYLDSEDKLYVKNWAGSDIEVEEGDWVVKFDDDEFMVLSDEDFNNQYMKYESTREDMSNEETIKMVKDKVDSFHPLESEFQEVIEENFNDMICPVEEDPLKDQNKKPMVYTSYYSNPFLRRLSPKEVSKISISIHPPKGWKEKGKLWYYPLCPTEKIFNEVKSTGNHQEYIRQLQEQLSHLNPQKVYSDLMNMSYGKPVILLCYEKPQPTVGDYVYCHRQIVAEWLSSNLGIIVPELTEKHVQSIIGSDSDESSLF